MNRPIIGITTSGRHETNCQSRFYNEHFAVATLYVDAVRRAGGYPLLLPPGESDWEEIIDLLDGVIITGGGDIDPVHYGGNREHEKVARIDPERDATELVFTRLLVERGDQPMLCVCRGLQTLNVALGGTLYEHIPDVRDPDIHRQPDGDWAVQPVDVQADSLLAQVMDSTHVETYSGHHQAVKDVAPGLTVSATAPDGIIEALELEGHPWLVAVQWHPEKSAKDDPTQQRIFDRLVQQAAARKAARTQMAMGE